jgi:hypothetical protein
MATATITVGALLDNLDEALATHHNAAKRVAAAREALEATQAELFGENLIVGHNREERDACLHRLTAAERYEITEAENALEAAARRVVVARENLNRTRWAA